MNFYYYVYLRSSRVTIHRAECPFCRHGKGLQRKIFKDANGFWNGPYPDYEAVLEQASTKAREIQVVPIDCKHCRPLLAGASTASDKEKKCSSELMKQSTFAHERNRLPTLKQLEQQHATEQRQFAIFYQNIQQLMQERHRAEQESGEMHAMGLEVQSTSVEHHAQQVAELAQAQSVSYALLQKKQAEEKDDLLSRLLP